MRNLAFDAAIAGVARFQHGVVGRAQVRAAGGSRTIVADRVATGSWIRLAPGVWALRGFPPTWQRQYKAAELSRPDEVLGLLLDAGRWQAVPVV